MNENRSVKKKEKKAVIVVLAVMAAIVLFSIPVLISSLGEGGGEETDETTRLIYGYWVWQEERNCWICNGVEYGNNQCELVYKL